MKNVLTTAFLFGYLLSASQTVINGGFETDLKDGCGVDLSNSAFNEVISGVTAFGDYGNIDLLGDGCSEYGAPQSGDHFVGLSISGAEGMRDQVALALSGPIEGGVSYMLHFYVKKDAASANDPFQVGFSSIDTGAGEVMMTFNDVYGTVWQERTMEFAIPITSEIYITFSPVADNAGEIHLDNVFLESMASVDETSAYNRVAVYPNPATDRIGILSGLAIKDLSITDLSGRKIIWNKVNALSTTLDIETLIPGIYLVDIALADGSHAVRRIEKK